MSLGQFGTGAEVSVNWSGDIRRGKQIGTTSFAERPYENFQNVHSSDITCDVTQVAVEAFQSGEGEVDLVECGAELWIFRSRNGLFWCILRQKVGVIHPE